MTGTELAENSVMICLKWADFQFRRNIDGSRPGVYDNNTMVFDPVLMHGKRQQQFYDKCSGLGLDVDKRYFWYHTIDLGNGLITPGVFDFRQHLGQYAFPDNMDGISVLDVGAATGFFSFEFVRRGATVTATELPSMFELDAFPGQNIADVLEKFKKYASGYVYQKPDKMDIGLLYKLLLIEPFNFCGRQLGISVPRRFVNIYDFSAETLGRPAFDWVFIGDVLLHTIDPLKALASAAKMCSGTLVLAQHIPELNSGLPLLLYTGGDDIKDDVSAWFRPNVPWFQQVLKKLGFFSVEVVGNFNDEFLPNGHSESKAVIYARR